MDAITSIHNERVKQVRALHDRRERRTKGMLCIEGPRFIREATEAGAVVSACFFVEKGLGPADQQLLMRLQAGGADLIPVTEQVMASLSDTTTPQGMVAVAEAPAYASPQQLLQPGGLILVADQVRDPGNLGTMLRTAAAIGAGMILLAGCTDPTGPKVVRGSAGACYSVPMWYSPTEDEVIQALQRARYNVIVLEMDGADSLYATDLKGSVAVVVGNEGHGPSPAWVKHGAQQAYIPMPGRAESLNAGVAAAVVLYEALRQRTEGC